MAAGAAIRDMPAKRDPSEPKNQVLALSAIEWKIMELEKEMYGEMVLSK